VKLFALALFGAAVVLAPSSVVAAELPNKTIAMAAPKPLPDVQFEDGQGHRGNLSDFRGKIVLLTIWATWCAPCRREMPTLDRLQATLGGPDFQVTPLSIDRGGADVVRKFFAQIGIKHLAIRLDSSGEVLQSLAVVGLPTTVLIDPKGREIGRLIGPADWDTPQMIADLKSVIARRSGVAPNTKQK